MESLPENRSIENVKTSKKTFIKRRTTSFREIRRR